jgi:hypothetical protein
MTPAEVLLAYDPDDVKPGWIALVLVLMLALATFLLWRSMNTQLGRIKAPHRADLAPPADAADENSVDVSETPPAEPQDESEPDRGDQEPPH